MLHISDLLLKLPTQLSGGQKQRVAIARGIVKNTDIFVLDDPLAGLDFKLREQLFDDLKVLQEKLKRVGAPTRLHLVEEADSNFRVTKKSGIEPAAVHAAVLDSLASWIQSQLDVP